MHIRWGVLTQSRWAPHSLCGAFNICFTLFNLSAGTIMSTCKASFKSVVSYSSVGRRKSASTDCCLKPDRCRTSSWNANRRRWQHTSLHDALARFQIQRNASWLIFSLKWAPARYEFIWEYGSKNSEIFLVCGRASAPSIFEGSWPITKWLFCSLWMFFADVVREWDQFGDHIRQYPNCRYLLIEEGQHLQGVQIVLWCS